MPASDAQVPSVEGPRIGQVAVGSRELLPCPVSGASLRFFSTALERVPMQRSNVPGARTAKFGLGIVGSVLLSPPIVDVPDPAVPLSREATETGPEPPAIRWQEYSLMARETISP